MPYQCEIVTVSGLDEVTGKWEVYKDKIYKTYIPWSVGAGNNMLFVNNKLTVQGRHPNGNTGGLPMPPTTNALSPLWPAFGKFNITNGSNIITSFDLKQSTDFWKGAIYVGFHKWSWCMQTAIVESSTNGRIKYTKPTARFWFPDQADPLKEWFRDGNYDVMVNIQNGFLTA